MAVPAQQRRRLASQCERRSPELRAVVLYPFLSSLIQTPAERRARPRVPRLVLLMLGGGGACFGLGSVGV